MKRLSNPRRLCALALALLPLAACEGMRVVEKAAPKKLLGQAAADELERLFAPMQQLGTVACNVLTVRTSRALWDRFTYPVRSRVCKIDFETGIDAPSGKASRYTFQNLGGPDFPLKFVIGKRKFLVLGGAKLEVHSGPPRFDLAAEGNVLSMVKGGQASERSAVRVEEGRWIEL